jgi:hypothetical protein
VDKTERNEEAQDWREECVGDETLEEQRGVRVKEWMSDAPE